MRADSVLTVVVALCCVLAIGATSTTLDSTVETNPEEVTDFDYSKVPIGSEQAQKLDDALDRGRSASGESRSAEDGSPEQSSSGDEQMQAAKADAAEDGDYTKSAEDGEDGSPEQEAGSGANERQQQSGGSGEQSQGGSSESAQSGSGAGASDPPLLQQLIWLLRDLLELLMDLLPYLVTATLVGAAVRYRDRIYARIAPDAAAGRDDEGEPLPDPDPQNAVSAAWFEMIERLDLDDRRDLTPRECAAAARAHGADAEAVRNLTALFEEVRYGGARVTDERRERAEKTVEHLRSQLEVGQ
jgi:hypothetical protein